MPFYIAEDALRDLEEEQERKKCSYECERNAMRCASDAARAIQNRVWEDPRPSLVT